MHHIVYVSRATTLFTAPQLVALLRQAQAANSRAGVTGLLVYSDGRFMQVLEGEEAAVVATYERIVRDPRHCAIYKVADKAIAERVFMAWSMSFREVNPEQFSQLTGYLPPQRLANATFAFASADDNLLTQLRNLVLPAGSVHH